MLCWHGWDIVSAVAEPCQLLLHHDAGCDRIRVWRDCYMTYADEIICWWVFGSADAQLLQIYIFFFHSCYFFLHHHPHQHHNKKVCGKKNTQRSKTAQVWNASFIFLWVCLCFCLCLLSIYLSYCILYIYICLNVCLSVYLWHRTAANRFFSLCFSNEPKLLKVKQRELNYKNHQQQHKHT